MASIHTFRKISLFIFFTTFIFSACTRVGTSELGLELLSADGINTKDTILEVETETFDRIDSLRIYASDDHILGELNNDPMFGKTKATMFFQMLPSDFPFFIPGNKDSITVDSAVLVLKYKGFYGDSTRPLKININQIDPSTPLDPFVYYPANYPDVSGLRVGAALGNPYMLDFANAQDSVKNLFELAKGQIRIKLFDRVANMFIKTFDSTNAYRSDTTLREYFPGFALTVDPSSNNNVLVRINLLDTNTKLALYYKTNYVSAGDTRKRDTIVSYMRFLAYHNGDANFITRNRTGSEVSRHMNGNANDSLVYIQSSPGTMVKIKIPGIKTFANKLIHRAELVTEQVPDAASLSTTEAIMAPPNYLFLGAYDANKKEFRTVPNDFQGTTDVELMKRFGGSLIYKSLNGFDKVASYNFNITRYVQGVISRKDSLFDFRMYAPVNDSIPFVHAYPFNQTTSIDYLGTILGNQPAMGRVRLGGGTHSKFRMRLHIYYSDL